MKLQILIVIIILLISSIFIFVYLNFENEKINALDIHIGNISNKTYNGTISILNSKEKEIFNQTFIIKNGQQIEYSDITNKIGKYTLIIFLDDGRIEVFNRVYVDEYSHRVSVSIQNDKIHIVQKVE